MVSVCLALQLTGSDQNLVFLLRANTRSQLNSKQQLVKQLALSWRATPIALMANCVSSGSGRNFTLQKELPEKALPKFKANHGGFSVSISGRVNFKKGAYRFMGSTRGAVKASVDGVTMIDFWGKAVKE